MKKNYIIVVFSGVLISLFLYLISAYLTATGLIVTGTLALLFFMSESAENIMQRPILSAYPKPGNKSFTVVNLGNKSALDISIEVLPHNLEFFITNLNSDENYDIECEKFLGNSRVFFTYSDDKGKRYEKNLELKSDIVTDYDPTKPLIPIFE